MTDDRGDARAPIDDDLLRILVCPVDRAELRAGDGFLVCTRCDRRYPVEDGIPNMLVDAVRANVRSTAAAILVP